MADFYTSVEKSDVFECKCRQVSSKISGNIMLELIKTTANKKGRSAALMIRFSIICSYCINFS